MYDYTQDEKQERDKRSRRRQTASGITALAVAVGFGWFGQLETGIGVCFGATVVFSFWGYDRLS